jgi:hypothetical protein
MMESGETWLNNHSLGNRGGSLSFLVGTISNVLVMEIGWTDVEMYILFYNCTNRLRKMNAVIYK